MSAGIDTTSTAPDETAAVAEPKLRFAFVIAVDEQGNVFVERDIKALAIPVERAATLLEIRRYTQDVFSDLQAQASAEYVTSRLMAMGEQQAQAPAPEQEA